VSTGGPGGGRRDLRYTRDVGPGDAGVRISLRRRLPEGGMSDVLGDLLSWADGVVRVRDRHGAEHEVEEDAVVAAKRIPPPPAPRR
jgi:hypothetical protein